MMGDRPEGAYSIDDYDQNVPDKNDPYNYQPMWITDHCQDIEKVIFDDSFADARPTTCCAWFYKCNVKSFEGIKNLNTTNVTDMSRMFFYCSSLTTLDVSGFDTKNVKDMGRMFGGCTGLTTLNVSNFDTRNVTTMIGMFFDCNKLTTLDLSNFNTDNVTDMCGVFYNCQKLKTVNLSNFNTGNVTDMDLMFENCYELTTLDLSSFNTSKVTDMSYMFHGCNELTSLDLSNFNTVNITKTTGMFLSCFKITTIYISNNFVTTNVTEDEYMFENCTALKGACEYNENKTGIEMANYYTGYLKSYYKIGDEKHSICGEDLKVDNFELIDGKDFMTVIPFEASVASYNRTIKEGISWATLCLPFEVSLADKNFRAFKLLKVSNDVVELEEINANIDAGNPVIIKMTNGATSINIAENNKTIVKDVQASEKVYGCQLVGLYTQKMFDKNVDNNCFIVKGNKLMNPAKLLANENVASVGSKGFRAYMQTDTPATSMAKAYSIGLDNETTAIGQLETTADEKAEYYDLQGNRLNDLQKGVNIVKRGNKTTKVIIK